MAIIRAAGYGTARAHAYAVLSLRFAAKILYGLCFLCFYAWRNRRNAPSMARFSLTCLPWQVISVFHVHNPTVSKRLRYSLNQNIYVRPSRAVACPPYSVTVFSFARLLPSHFNKLGCTAKITCICCDGLQMLMHIYCRWLQTLMCS